MGQGVCQDLWLPNWQPWVWRSGIDCDYMLVPPWRTMCFRQVDVLVAAQSPRCLAALCWAALWAVAWEPWAPRIHKLQEWSI